MYQHYVYHTGDTKTGYAFYPGPLGAAQTLMTPHECLVYACRLYMIDF